jgi:hypothetical protein
MMSDNYNKYPPIFISSDLTYRMDLNWSKHVNTAYLISCINTRLDIEFLILNFMRLLVNKNDKYRQGIYFIRFNKNLLIKRIRTHKCRAFSAFDRFTLFRAPNAKIIISLLIAYINK